MLVYSFYEDVYFFPNLKKYHHIFMEFWSFLGGNPSFQLLKGYFFLDFEKSHHFSVKKVVTFFQKSQFGNNL